MELKRRDFLQAAGVWLVGVSSSEFILQLVNSPGLAATTPPRKRALLIGINHYGTGEVLPSLQGCLTDVELQKQLLRYRLAWAAGDIQVLTNQGATRTAIQAAIEEFLLAGATSGDRLFLHFSGYGRQVSGLGETLIPYDVQADGSGDLPLSWFSQKHLPAGVTFWCCFDAGFQPNPGLAQRVRPPIGTSLNLSLRPSPGMIWLQPTIAREIQLLGTQAGALTQSITKQLWSNASTSSLSGYWAAQDLERQTGELTHLHWQAEAGARIPGTLNLNGGLTLSGPGADAAIITSAQDSQTAQIWLGGMASPLLTQAGWQSYFEPVGPELPKTNPAILVQNPVGLTAIAPMTDLSTLTTGTLLRERLRLLPHHLTLTIGLAETLDKVTRIDAVSGLDGLTDWVSSTTEGTGDYRVMAQSDAEHCLYGLAWPGGTVFPQTLGTPGEAIKGAIRRLGTMFPVLLANKWLGLTLNGETSGLGVTVAWEKLLPQPELLLRVQTERALWAAPETAIGNFSAQAWERGVTFQVGQQFCYRLTNYSPAPVYALWLAWDSAAGLLVLPTLMDSPQLTWQLTLAPQLTTTLPVRELRYTSPCVNSYLLLSRTPFTQALDYLAQLPTSGDPPRLVPSKEALALVQAILRDLHQNNPESPLKPATTSAYTLDLQAWATFCFTFRVV
ncbi:caspase family protein [Synechococcus sp. PCC 6312]|uniref:caspase family protein n=1 Tax=Synechococcus sp. (strain ATCC 27167 / PCC 6312) TaxID=195253 RepID=UPI00029F1B18|nr:caspase family protein [Synechococcus sp. PCC 6312]AFY59648.1 Caspase domain-containing protein [Synechococcus sp. PCC 6312]